MSVCSVKREICEVAKFVEQVGDYHRNVFNHLEESRIKCFYKPEEFVQKAKEIQKNNIRSWATRLWYANQMALLITYEETLDGSREIDEMKDADIDRAEFIHSAPAIFHKIEHIKYNLVSNGGRMMIADDDLDKLSDLQNDIATRLIRRPEYGLL